MLFFNSGLNNHVIYIERSTAGVWAAFWIKTAAPLFVSSSNNTNSEGIIRMIYNV
jgi:hypothetical protein